MRYGVCASAYGLNLMRVSFAAALDDGRRTIAIGRIRRKGPGGPPAIPAPKPTVRRRSRPCGAKPKTMELTELSTCGSRSRAARAATSAGSGSSGWRRRGLRSGSPRRPSPTPPRAEFASAPPRGDEARPPAPGYSRGSAGRLPGAWRAKSGTPYARQRGTRSPRRQDRTPTCGRSARHTACFRSRPTAP